MEVLSCQNGGLGQSYGYSPTTVPKPAGMRMRKIRVIDGRDRMRLFVDGKLMAAQYQAEIGQDIFVTGERKPPTVLTSWWKTWGGSTTGISSWQIPSERDSGRGVCKDLLHELAAVSTSLKHRKHWFSKDGNQSNQLSFAFDFEAKKLRILIRLSSFGKGLAL